MDIDTLQVFNVLYRLGITEHEFKEIADEQKQTDHTGLAIVAVKKGRIIAISHDEKHQIIIRRLTGNLKPIPKSRILFKTLTTVWDLPPEIYTLHHIAQYRALDTEVRYTADSLEELKDRICDRFSDEYPKELGEKYNDVYEDFETRKKNSILKPRLVEEQLRAIYWLFGEQFEAVKISAIRPNITRIIKVFVRNNRRVALFGTYEKWNKRRGSLFSSYQWNELIKRTTFKIATYTPSQECFNFVSPDREVFFKNTYEEKADVWVSDELQGRISAEELRIFSQRFDREWILLTADEFNKQRATVRIEMLNAQKKEQEDSAKKRLINSIRKQFKSGSVTRFGITFTPNSVEYNGIKLRGTHIGEYVAGQNVLMQERPEFNEIFEGYVDFILDLDVGRDFYSNSRNRIICRFKGREKLSVGNVHISIEQKGNAVYVNKFKIRKDDLRQIVIRALGFTKQTDYDEWIHETSRCNLFLQEVIRKGGLTFQLQYSATEDNCLLSEKKTKIVLLSIPVSRRANRNYTIINEKEYRIRDMHALVDIGKPSRVYQYACEDNTNDRVQRSIKLLYRAIDGISSQTIGDLIRNGIAEYRKLTARIKRENTEKIKRSKEFVAYAVKLTQATKTDKGYLVRGLSGTVYFVDEEDLSVWTVKNGKQNAHLCIVDTDYSSDDNEDDALRNDRIAKRLLMLSKDKVVADEVFERGDKMDKHWVSINREMQKENIGEVV